MVFSGSALVLGLTASIGGGLMIACVSVLIYFVVRALMRWKAEKDFKAFLSAHRNSCSVCEDIVASVKCRVCDELLCSGCGELECSKSKEKHDLRPIVLDEGIQTLAQDADARPVSPWHYQSFAHVRSHRSINFADDD